MSVTPLRWLSARYGELNGDEDDRRHWLVVITLRAMTIQRLIAGMKAAAR